MSGYIRIILQAFREFIKEIWQDVMFAALLFVPLLMCLLFRFGIPLLERELCEMQHVGTMITPYYFCFDLCIIMMTPIMFSFAGVMVILGELDNGLARYLMVTPLGKKGYLWSRIGMLSVIAMVYADISILVFRLSDLSVWNILYCGVISAMITTFANSGRCCRGARSPVFVLLSISFFVVSLAHNKVEGMALTKFSAFFVLGIPIAVFIKIPYKYIGFFLPSFWTTEFCIRGQIVDAVMGLVVGGILLYISFRRFAGRIS